MFLAISVVFRTLTDAANVVTAPRPGTEIRSEFRSFDDESFSRSHAAGSFLLSPLRLFWDNLPHDRSTLLSNALLRFPRVTFDIPTESSKPVPRLTLL